MEFEELRAAWQRDKAAHPPRKVDTKAILAQTMKLVEQRNRDFKRQQRTQILCGLLCLGIMATWCSRDNSLLANAGLIVMIICLALMLAGSIILRYRQRESHPWLPEEAFLNEERKKIVARIALMRRNTMWLFIPCMLGFLTWQLELSHSHQMVIALLAIAAVASAGMFWLYRWKLRKDLLPMLEDIDRDLEQVRKDAETWSWSD
jgi:hypothetical protein